MALKSIVVTNPQDVYLLVYKVDENFSISEADSLHSLISNGTPVNLFEDEFLEIVPKLDSEKLFIIDADSSKSEYYDFINNKLL